MSKLLSVTVLLFFTVPLVMAEPYLAQRYGQKCSTCHTNITGGGKRTDAGNGYAMGLSSTPVNSPFSPKLLDAISIGADFRADWTYSKFDKPKSVGQGQAGPVVDDTSTFNQSNGTVYLDFKLSDKLFFYIDQQVAPEGGRTRESVAVLSDFFADDSYIKVGKFFLPFGLRLQDDEAFIREASGFNFDNSDTGVEVGFEPGPFSLSLAVSNGTQGAGENNTDKQVSMVGSFIQNQYRVGLSYAKNNGPNGVSRQAYNIFGGYSFDKVVLLAEYDWIEDSNPNAADIDQNVAFISANYLLNPSTNIKLSYEYLDPHDDIDENERTRISLLAEKFFNQYVQVRGGVRVLEGIPQNALHNQQTLFAELHLFF